MYKNDKYMTVHDALVLLHPVYQDQIPNPFPNDFLIFDKIQIGTDSNNNPIYHNTYGLNDNDLWNIFNEWYASMCIGKRVPPLGYQWVYRGTDLTVLTERNQAFYVWNSLCDQVGWYCKSNYNRWKHLILADTADYDPITNYNMEELAGNTSKVAQMGTTPGTVTSTAKTAPFDGANHDLSQTVTSQTKTTSGYESENKKLSWGDLETPEGNSTSVSKLVRKGNIGVTTSQQMIASEYELRKFNVLQDFMNEVCKYSMLCDWDSMLNNQY